MSDTLSPLGAAPPPCPKCGHAPSAHEPRYVGFRGFVCGRFKGAGFRDERRVVSICVVCQDTPAIGGTPCSEMAHYRALMEMA